ncbi:MAG: sulfatase-like hydrolase/transferase, partial [Bacteroidota bacterium]
MQGVLRATHYLAQLLLRLGIVYLLFAICRLVFYLANLGAFPELAGGDLLTIFLAALRFDTVAIVYTNALFILSYLVPLPWRDRDWYRKGQLLLFLSFNFLALLLELIDAGFFGFSFRRSGVSDLKMMLNSFQVTPRYLLDYWYLLLLLFAALYALHWLYHKTQLSRRGPPASGWSQLLVFVLALPLGILAARGGWQLRPLMPIMASDFVEDVRLAPLVSNTTLSMIFSTQQRVLQIPNYLPEAAVDRLFPVREAPADTMLRKNVVILVLESFGEANVGYFRDGDDSPTPFFDSLYARCWKTPVAFANGLRSTQGIVAITTGIPSLMEEPLMFSAYQSNRTQGLADLLGREGYTTAFFHGSNPGSMLFESFAQRSGFQYFYDKTDYANEADYDGKWGIWDRPFFQSFARTID